MIDAVRRGAAPEIVFAALERRGTLRHIVVHTTLSTKRGLVACGRYVAAITTIRPAISRNRIEAQE
jgi:hypothetical protein